MGTRDIRGRGFRTKAIRGAAVPLPDKESPTEAGQVHPGRKIKMKRTNANSKTIGPGRSSRIRTHSLIQKMTVAAMQIAEKNVWAARS